MITKKCRRAVERANKALSRALQSKRLRPWESEPLCRAQIALDKWLQEHEDKSK